MKIDPYKHREKHENWLRNGREIKGVCGENRKLILQYLEDMEAGMYVSRGGPLGYARLNNLRQRLAFVTRQVERMYGGRLLVELGEREIVGVFRAMRDGQIRTRQGGRYVSVPDYVNVFKACWHWHQRVEGESGRTVRDVTRYIDARPVREPEFVYLTFEDVRRLADQAKFEYKVLMWFLFDSGVRAPTELVNIRACDLIESEGSEGLQLSIREEAAMTFGRRIRLLLCGEYLRRYIREKRIADGEVLFDICPKVVNQYLKRLAVRVLGDVRTKGGESTSQLTMYDFRHASACYWLPRYKSESALKYRFGWKKEQMVHYYTKLLGMRDTISEQDLLMDTGAVTKLEREVEAAQRKNAELAEQVESQRAEQQLVGRELRVVRELLDGLAAKHERIVQQVAALRDTIPKGRSRSNVPRASKTDLAAGRVHAPAA